MKTVTSSIGGMRCDGCAGRMRSLLAAVPGVREASASFAGGAARVRYNPHATNEARLVIEKAGFTARLGYTPGPPEPLTADRTAGAGGAASRGARPASR